MTIKVENIVAFITGANRGVDRAIAEGLLDAGATKVYAAVRTISASDELTAKYPGRIVPVEYDLAGPELVGAAVKNATDTNLVVTHVSLSSQRRWTTMRLKG